MQRFGVFNFQDGYAKSPDDLKCLFDNHESLPFRRRG
jgi:hypothetical protein